MRKKTQFDAIFFVIFSLACFAVFGVLYIVLTKGIYYSSPSVPAETEDEYFFNKNWQSSDPLITNNPNLNEILSGPIISANDPNMGYEDAPVVIVEYSDFACKYCYEQEQAIKRLLQNHKYDIKLIWKDYPEMNEDSGSYTAALAARCAGRQDSFWPFHDMLFDSSGDLNRDKYLKAAGLLGLNMDDFISCLDNKETKSAINDNITEAQALDIVGVPFIFVNDREVMGQAGYEDLEKMVREELKKTNP